MAEQLTLGIRLGATTAPSYERVIGQAKRDIAKLDDSQQRLGAGARRGRAGMLGATAALRPYALALGATAISIAAPVKAAIEFESVMADVRKVVDFDTPQQFAQMRTDILDLSTKLPIAASGIGAIVAAAGQAGIARVELLRFTEDAAKMAVAFDLPAARAGSAMTGLRSIFHLNQDQVVGLGDAYNHLSNNMDATAADIVNISNRAGGMAVQFGLSGEQVGALAATFRVLKTPPEVAATSINALLLKLATADKQGRKFRDALDDIGFGAEELKDHIQDDAQGALLSFLKVVKESPDVLGTLSDLFGAEHSDELAKLIGGIDKYQDALKLIGHPSQFAGSMEREFEQRAATTSNNIQLLKNEVNRLGVELGDLALPAVNTGVTGLAYGLGQLNEAVRLTRTTLEEGYDPQKWREAAKELMDLWSGSGEPDSEPGLLGKLLLPADKWASDLVGGLDKRVRDQVLGFVAEMEAAVEKFRPLGWVISAWESVRDWVPGFSVDAPSSALVGGMTDEAEKFRPLGWVISAWESVRDWVPGFSVDASSAALVGGMTDEAEKFRPLGWVISAWESVRDWVPGFSVAASSSALVGGMTDEAEKFRPLGWVISAWESVRDWVPGFSVAASSSALVGGMTDEAEKFRPLGWVISAWESVRDWVPGFSVAASSSALVGGMTDEAEKFRPLGWVISAWESVRDWVPGFSVAASSSALVGGMTDEAEKFRPLGWVISAWESAATWMRNDGLKDMVGSTWDTIHGMHDALFFFDPEDWMRAAWGAAKDWLPKFGVGGMVDATSALVGEMTTAVKEFDPKDWTKSAWEDAAAWLKGFDMGAAAKEMVGNTVAVMNETLEAAKTGGQMVGSAAADAWVSFINWLTGDEEAPGGVGMAREDGGPVVGAIHAGTERITGKLSEILAALPGATPVRGVAAAAVIATAAAVGAPGPTRAVTVNVNATINLEAAGVNLDTLRDELQPLVVDMMRQASDAVFGAEADEVEG